MEARRPDPKVSGQAERHQPIKAQAGRGQSILNANSKGEHSRIRLQHTVGGQAGPLNSICLLFSYLGLSWAQSDSFVGKIAFQSLGGRSSAVVLCTQAANPGPEPRTNRHVSRIPPDGVVFQHAIRVGAPHNERLVIRMRPAVKFRKMFSPGGDFGPGFTNIFQPIRHSSSASGISACI